jgi:predicted helicase
LVQAGDIKGEQTNWIERFTAENTARVERQKRSPIRVIIGNPPYNAWQLNENDNNKNRKYKVMDRRVAETFAKESKATNKSSLSDPYVKAIRWASDRIGDEGVVAFVSNNSFVDNLAFDGMRKQLAHDFDEIYILDLGGNVRKNPKLSGTTHNVFGIQVGVSVNLFVRKRRGVASNGNGKAKIHYARVDEFWRKEEKYAYLDERQHRGQIAWQELQPDAKGNWLSESTPNDFDLLVPLAAGGNVPGIFAVVSNGVQTNRDIWVYNFEPSILDSNVRTLIQTYNDDLWRWQKRKKGDDESVDAFVTYDETKIKWSSRLKSCFASGTEAVFGPSKIRNSIYRPFTFKYLYFDDMLTHRRGQFFRIFPTEASEGENQALSLVAIGENRPFHCLMTRTMPDLHLTATTQSYAFYTYNEDGTNRRENITDWALEQFRTHYADKSITKWDIFHYVYALLHHPLYRERYAANLKRELPRIPFAPDFRAFTDIGKQLAEIHVNYEQQTEYGLERLEKPGAQLDWRVERMKLSKDKRSLIYNDFLTLSGIPPEVFEYRLGNRSALEWIIDQYQVSTDKRSGITNDPNRADDPQYIVRLIGQVVTVSVETVTHVRSLANLPILADIDK